MRVQPRRHAKRAAGRDEQQPLRAQICAAQAHRAGRQRYQLPVFGLRHVPDIFPDPLPEPRRFPAEFLFLRLRKRVQQRRAAAGQRLRANARAEDLAQCAHVLWQIVRGKRQCFAQHLGADVAQVFFGERLQKRKLLRRAKRGLRQKLCQRIKIPAGRTQNGFDLRAIAKFRAQHLHVGRVIRRFHPEAAFFIR